MESIALKARQLLKSHSSAYTNGRFNQMLYKNKAYTNGYSLRLL